MRLSPENLALLQATLRRFFGAEAVTYLYGSRLESVSALVERFGKPRDLLSGVFREIAVLSGDDASDMNRVFARMEKIGILASAEQWRAMRVLRNLGAHEYDPSDAGRTRFINALAADASELMAIAARAVDYARRHMR